MSGLQVRAAADLGEVIAFLTGEGTLPTVPPTIPVPDPLTDEARDLSSLRLPTEVVRSLEIAVAGHHPLLLVGPPGAR